MSDDIFLFSLQGHEGRPFPCSIVTEAWGPHLKTNADGEQSLSFPDGSECDITISGIRGKPGSDGIVSIGINRPPASDAFWQGLFEIMCLTRCCLVGPAGRPIVADAAAIPLIPEDFGDPDAKPRLTRRWQDLVRFIWED